MAAILFFDYLKTGPNILASLDRFGTKNILFVTLFCITRSRLATIWNPDKKVRFSNGPDINVQDWHKIESENRPRLGFQMVTVLYKVGIIRSLFKRLNHL
jgi:hypothetical protein